MRFGKYSLIAVIVAIVIIAIVTGTQLPGSIPAIAVDQRFLVESFLYTGGFMTVIGTMITSISFRSREIEVQNVTRDFTTSNVSSATGFTYWAGVVSVRHPGWSEITVAFKESQGRNVDVWIQDFIPQYGSAQNILALRHVQGSNAETSVSVRPGKYEIQVHSLDSTNRAVSLRVRVSNQEIPLRHWREIGLTLVTVGTFFLLEAVLRVFGP